MDKETLMNAISEKEKEMDMLLEMLQTIEECEIEEESQKAIDYRYERLSEIETIGAHMAELIKAYVRDYYSDEYEDMIAELEYEIIKSDLATYRGEYE